MIIKLDAIKLMILYKTPEQYITYLYLDGNGFFFNIFSFVCSSFALWVWF